jgi:hypothetical protein
LTVRPVNDGQPWSAHFARNQVVSHGTDATLAYCSEKWHIGSRSINVELIMNQHALDGLVALKLVAEKRNFTAAADELGISPPAISKIIKLLEHRLGVALLSRTTRSTSLTEAGERFLNQVAPAVDQVVAAM